MAGYEPQKTFGLVVQQIECMTFTIAHAVSAMGWKVIVFADPTLNQSKQNALYIKHLSRLPGVSVEMGLQPVDLDWLYVELTRLTPADRAAYYCRRAKRVGILTYAEPTTWAQTVLGQLRDARRCPRCVLRASRVLYTEGYSGIDPLGLLAQRQHVGIDVHSSFLLDPVLREKMFALDWDPQRHREHRLNFMGSREPQARARILVDVEAALQKRNVTLARTPNEAADVVWLVAAPVPEERFCGLLTESDYTLCPRGYSRLTHRVVEALLRGSIPVLQADELALYDLELTSGTNCIAVSPGHWGQAVAAALDADQADVVRMRTNILKMRESYLTIEVSNRRLCQRLGIGAIAAPGTASP